MQAEAYSGQANGVKACAWNVASVEWLMTTIMHACLGACFGFGLWGLVLLLLGHAMPSSAVVVVVARTHARLRISVVT